MVPPEAAPPVAVVPPEAAPPVAAVPPEAAPPVAVVPPEAAVPPLAVDPPEPNGALAPVPAWAVPPEAETLPPEPIWAPPCPFSPSTPASSPLVRVAQPESRKIKSEEDASCRLNVIRYQEGQDAGGGRTRQSAIRCANFKRNGGSVNLSQIREEPPGERNIVLAPCLA